MQEHLEYYKSHLPKNAQRNFDRMYINQKNQFYNAFYSSIKTIAIQGKDPYYSILNLIFKY